MVMAVKLRNGSILCCGVALYSLTAIPAHAQSVSDDATEIVVTANKRTEPLQQVPSSVSAVSGEAIEQAGSSRLGDILASTPGVTLKGSGYPGRNALVIRGISSGASQAGASVGVYVDDTPIGSSTVFSIAANLTPDIDPYDLARVEILRGPQGTLYGANTLGGLLKFVTRAPDLDNFEVGGRLQASTTAGDESVLIGARVNLPVVTDRLAIRASGSFRRDAGWIDNLATGNRDVNASRTTSGRAALALHPDDRFAVKLNYLYQKIDADGPGYVEVGRNMQPLSGDLTQRTLLKEPSDTLFHVVSGTASYDFGGVELSAITSYAYSRSGARRDSSLDFQPLLGITNPIALDIESTTKKFTEEVRLASDANKPLSFIAGAFFTNEDSSYRQSLSATNADGSVAASSPFARALRNNQVSNYKEYAVFGNITYIVSPLFDVTLGARYSKNDQHVQFQRSGLFGNPSNPTGTSIVNNESSDEVTTYLANARLHLAKDKMLYVRVASGYRPGGPRNFPPVAIPPGIASQFLPDQVWNYEAGLKSKWLDGAVTLNLAAFRIDWEDIQLTQTISGFSLFSNGGRARSQGVELEMDLRPAPGFLVRYNAAYTDAKLRDSTASLGARAGDAIPYIPKWSVGVDASYRFGVSDRWDLSFGAAYQLQDERASGFSLDAARIALPSYDTVDLRAAALSTDGFEVTAFVRNLGNTRGYLNSEATGAIYRAAIIQPRTVGVGVSKSF